MPAARAAAVKLMPSSALAMASNRFTLRGAASPRASARRSVAVWRSVLISVFLPCTSEPSEPMIGWLSMNHAAAILGIPESKILEAGHYCPGNARMS